MQITKLGNPSHGDLPGLGDDDHLQYLRTDGTRNSTGSQIFESNIVVWGNLTVSGTSTTLDVANMTVEDNIIELNKGEAGAGVTLGTAGIQIDRGSSTDAQVLWDEATDKWQVGIVGSLLNIVTSSGAVLMHDELGGLGDDDHTQYLLRTDFTTHSGDLVAGYTAADTTLSGELYAGYVAADAVVTAAFIAADTALSGVLQPQIDDNVTAIGLNTTHRSSVGTDHSGVALIDGSRNFTGQETFESNVVILGDLVVSGTQFIAEVEEVLIEDNTMVLNYGEVGAGVTAGTAGIEIDRGSETNYRFIFDETDDNFQIGVSGTEQAVATREDSPTDTYVPFWNDAQSRFDTSGSMAYTDIASEADITTVSGELYAGYVAADVVVTNAFVAADVVVTNAFGAADTTLSGELSAEITADIATHAGDDNAHHEVFESLAGDTTPELGGDLDIGAFEIILDPTPDSDDTGSGFKSTVTVSGNASGVGAAMYQDTSGNYREADASVGTTMPCKGIALETGTGSKEILKIGYVRNDGWNWTSIGQPIYVSETTGAFTQTAPTTSGSFVQAVGTAESADVIDFNPDYNMVEVTA